MLKRLILITAAFFLLASPASAGAGINISVEVVVPIGNYTNSSVNLPANQTTFINASDAGTTLEISSSKNVSGAINLILTSTPLDIPTLSVPSLNKYLRIEASNSIANNLTYVVIKLYYTDEEVIASGIEEGSLGFYWWNRTSSAWDKLTPAMGWVKGAGVDTFENYVWANVTHFSDYSVGGLRLPPSLIITRDMPETVETNQKFDVKLHLYNTAGFNLFNISLNEKIPNGYYLRDTGIISPGPFYIRDEKGSKVIYWKFDYLAKNTNLSIKYSLSAPDSARNYTFKAKAFGFNASDKKYAAMNVAKQEVRKPSFLKRVLEFFGITE